MSKRLISSFIGLPLLIFIVFSGGVVLQSAIFAVAIIGLYEFYIAISQRIKFIYFTSFIFTAFYILILPYFPGIGSNMLFAALLITHLMLLVIKHNDLSLIDVCISLFGFFFVTFLVSFIYLVRNYNYGVYFSWLIFISAWGSDTFAYFVGKTFGKHKLIETLSPNKTVEGALGGVLGATLLGFLYGLVLKMFFKNLDLDLVVYFSVCAFICSILSQFGDLAASSIKRFANIKDYGSIIPGHGGFLDRFDSILFTAPGVYVVMILILDTLKGR